MIALVIPGVEALMTPTRSNVYVCVYVCICKYMVEPYIKGADRCICICVYMYVYTNR